jgi:CDP-glycerol glycerophosphotransferase
MTDHNSAVPSRLRRQVTGQIRRGVRRIRASRVGNILKPTVSIILPIYNVEEYLAECLDSIAEQTFSHYEVVVVDDGSPDGSRAIAEDYARTDPRIRIVTRENGGLGAARNTGVGEARGQYLTFVDSDDLLPPTALQSLVESAAATGSDIVVGAVQRFDSDRSWRPVWVDQVHLVERRGVRIDEFLPLIRNLYTWNKLFRRDFWEVQALEFREGVAYEDQPIITQLFARASAIDVLPDVVYHYRARDDRSSISQQTASLKDLRERVTAWETSRTVLQAEVSRSVYDGWLQTLFDAHFHWYLNSTGTVDDTYWSVLQAAVADFTADAPQHVWDDTPPDKRVLIELTRQNRRADAQEFVRLDSRKLDKWPAEPRADGIVLHLPFLGDPGLDDGLFLIRRDQLALAHSVENVHWHDDPVGTCSISGFAFIRKVDLSEHESSVAAVLRSSRTGVEHVYAATGRPKPAFAPPIDDSWCDYAPGTFHVDVPLADVVAEGDPDEEWGLLLRVESAGYTVTEPVSQLVRSGSAGVIPAATLPDGDRIVAVWRVHETLRFKRVPLALQATEVRLEGRTLSGTVAGPSVRDVKRVAVTCGQVVARARVTGRGERRRFSVDLPPAPDLNVQRPAQWEVAAFTIDEVPVGLTLREAADAVQTSGAGALGVERTRTGDLAVAEWKVGAVAQRLAVTREGRLNVSGFVRGPDVRMVALATRHKKTRAVGQEVPVSDGRFEAELLLQHHVYRFGEQPLPVGEHDFSLVVTGADGEPVDVPLKMSPGLSGELPILVDTLLHEGRVVRGPEGVVRLSLIRPIGDARGRYRQRQLQTTPPRADSLVRGVLMRAYFGEHATDNGVSIQKELQRRGSDLPVYWAVQDHSVPVPDGGIPVIVNSREWYRLLGSVKYYVDNMYQPEYHRKPDGQVIVQTFHGYPFKVMGHPHWQNLQFSQAKINAYDERAKAWDYLVSPARYATPLLTRDFAYDGEVLEIGYPRNDVLTSAEAGSIREQTRRSLGIADGQTAVLYAPTFRDYLAQGDNRATMADFFDLPAAARSLGDDVVILVRGHAFNARSRRRVGDLRGIVDVTDYPEVSDLYLAADAGVVDYSSLRFDFGVTGKPMVFHVPDLQRYKDTRGWLFDFEPTAPGPLVDTTEQVVEELKDLDGLRARHRDPYDAFRSEFLDLEDGQAGRRFVDAVFGSRGDA